MKLGRNYGYLKQMWKIFINHFIQKKNDEKNKQFEKSNYEIWTYFIFIQLINLLLLKKNKTNLFEIRKP